MFCPMFGDHALPAAIARMEASISGENQSYLAPILRGFGNASFAIMR